METITARKQIKHIIGGMRDTIYNLRPMIFDDIGWTAAWERLKKKFAEDYPKLEIALDIDMIDTSDGLTAISIYRIVCEGCQNIIKHSKASHIQISVKETGNQIKILIKDDGIGMQEYDQCPSNHFGLQFIIERVKALSGKMKITSDDSGTKISIKIPMKEGE